MPPALVSFKKLIPHMVNIFWLDCYHKSNIEEHNVCSEHSVEGRNNQQRPRTHPLIDKRTCKHLCLVLNPSCAALSTRKINVHFYKADRGEQKARASRHTKILDSSKPTKKTSHRRRVRDNAE